MNALGGLMFVLHTHIPYVRLAGRWPHGEEWIHEAICESYIPLLRGFYALRKKEVDFKLVMSITPVLADQLANQDIIQHLDYYLEERLNLAEIDIKSFQNPTVRHDYQDYDYLAALAQWYYEQYNAVREYWKNDLKGDIIGAFRELQDEGYLEIITSAATHAYLPLLKHDLAIDAQLKTAIHSYKKLFGKKPRGIWLPECGYRPAYLTKDGEIRKGLGAFLEKYDFEYFFSETHAMIGGEPVGVAAGDVLGRYGAIKNRYVLDFESTERNDNDTYQAYLLSEDDELTQVAVMGRNNVTGDQVWSEKNGYPLDFDYREFNKRAPTSGFQYWRVTDEQGNLGSKDYYHPDWARYKIDQHAEHFSHLVHDLISSYHEATSEYGLVVSMYDTELFGHWWYEGVNWLMKVLKRISNNPAVDLVQASAYLEAHPPTRSIHLPESSWGTGGGHFTWKNRETRWMWEAINEVETAMIKIAAEYQQPDSKEEQTLNQMARELQLLQSSDWEFLVTSAQARHYAVQRFRQHHQRFYILAESLAINQASNKLFRAIWDNDQLFSDIDYRVYQP
ncbi:1,4-alpha-glucan branching protein [Anaerolineales bacterium]